jgi:phenylalanyl-tRNA synthetase beta chain
MNELFAKIYENPPPILEHAELSKLFEHEKLGKESHNVTIHFVYRDREKTVSQEEVDSAHNELTARVGASFTGI